ncbi:MAG: (2Fe-2S)-binding protein [Rhodospirillales bacterium]|nr:(2Fe-2S)-binding protein [Rhodospirillales bacterium]
MYVCICHGLKESDVSAAQSAGAADAHGVFSNFGVEPQCGRCLSHLHGMMCQKSCKAKGQSGKHGHGQCTHS